MPPAPTKAKPKGGGASTERREPRQVCLVRLEKRRPFEAQGKQAAALQRARKRGCLVRCERVGCPIAKSRGVWYSRACKIIYVETASMIDESAKQPAKEYLAPNLSEQHQISTNTHNT